MNDRPNLWGDNRVGDPDDARLGSAPFLDFVHIGVFISLMRDHQAGNLDRSEYERLAIVQRDG